MKQLILGLILVLGFTTACVSKKDFEDLQGKVSKLENTVVANNISTLALITEVTDNVATVIGQATTGIGATIQQAVDAQNEVNAALVVANQAHAASILELATLVGAGSDLAGILQTQIDDLELEIARLEDDLDDLDEIVDDIEDTYVATEFTIWEPLFAVQTAAFDQTRHPLLNGIQLSATQSRTINVTSATTTVTVTSTELAEGVDVNGDNDQADSLTATYLETVHTGTVSGSTTNVGSHTTTGTLSAWVVSSND